MIRLRLGREPASLRAVRKVQLAVVRAIAAARSPKSDEMTGYGIVKPELWKHQCEKCCYCEMWRRPKYEDVEHFRPKAQANRAPGSVKTHGYWWLAWTWSNLLFACPDCNRTKRDKFPLAAGSVALEPEEAPPGRERPLLIDPRGIDPLIHLQFRPIKKQGVVQWLLFPRPGGDVQLAQRTIDTCGLNAASLLDFYKRHVDGIVNPAVEWLRHAMLGRVDTNPDDRVAVTAIWNGAILSLFDANQQFLALTYDVIDYLVPSTDLRRWGLSLPRP